MNIQLLYIAFKKLKAEVFFDKTQAILRNKIVEYEQSPNFDKEMKEMWECLNSIDDSVMMDFEGIDSIDCLHRILTQIRVAAFPKSIVPEGNGRIISNSPREKTEIEKIQYFIDMPVMGYILGVLWVMLIGKHIDKKIFDNSYGNRLKEVKSLGDVQAFSPYLFKPYFEQYESWRDNALKCAENLLNSHQDTLLITLDFKSFYYSINVDHEHFASLNPQSIWKELIDKESISLPCILMIHEFVESVMYHYSNELRKIDYDIVEERCVLPIGFLPSNIIANYALSAFDEAIINGWNPIYYGRYVDDLIFVTKIEKDSEIYNIAKNGELSQEKIMNYYFTNCSAWNKNELCDRHGLFQTQPDKNNHDEDDNNEDNANITYIVNKEYTTFDKCNITLQSKKVKIFYMDSENSPILFEKFRENIERNKSEFRYLPEDEYELNDDYSQIFDIIEKESPNKIRNIEGMFLDKYKFSKFLGKHLRICGLIDDHKERKFVNGLQRILTNQILIENYLTWEKILEVLIINEYTEECISFAKQITSAIDHISLSDKNVSNWRVLSTIKDSLRKVLYANLCRTLALLWGKKQDEIIMGLAQECSIFRDYNIYPMCLKYCQTRMIDKYALPLLIDGFFDKKGKWTIPASRSVNLTKFEEIRNLYNYNSINIIKDYELHPYLVTVADMAMIEYMNKFRNTNRNNHIDFNLVWKSFLSINYQSKPIQAETASLVQKECVIIVTEQNKSFDALKIAVANVDMDPMSLDRVLRKDPDRSYERYKHIVHLINTAISEKANILVLPEAYVPFEWIPIIARTCAKNKLAIITGVEQLIVPHHRHTSKEKVVNLTAVILPYEQNENKLALTWFHLKKNFAPSEKQAIESYGFIPQEGNVNELFSWNNFWFSVYCCYELTSIKDRAKYMSIVDAIFAVEFNKDTNYYSNIVSSLSRDMHCFCIQVNAASFGDTRITQPKRTEERDIVNVKGGINPTLLIGEINLSELRNFQISGYAKQKESKLYKLTPPDFNTEIVRAKIKGVLSPEMILKITEGR